MAGKKKTEAQEPQSLEENFSAVEELIGQLEAEDISLEEAFTAYSKGMNLLKQCSEQNIFQQRKDTRRPLLKP